ncbi:MAG: DNA-binding NarL/FixJ family response regulator, partial [Saprospiraceae bacterium]
GKLIFLMTTQKQTNILIVEDDAIIAHDISLLLKKSGYKIAGVCHNATKALDKLSKGGIDIAKKIHTTYKIPNIFLTSFSDEFTLNAAREQEPYGYLVKPFQEATLFSTISIALSNHRMQSQNVNFENLGIELTEKERSLCDQLYKGLSYQEIADTLSISINTIRYHLKTLYLKFDVNSRAELVGRILK